MNCGNWEIQTIDQSPSFLSTINSRRPGAQAHREVALYSSQPAEARLGSKPEHWAWNSYRAMRSESKAGCASTIRSGACDQAAAKTNLWRFQHLADPTQSHRTRLNGAPSSCMGHPPRTVARILIYSLLLTSSTSTKASRGPEVVTPRIFHLPAITAPTIGLNKPAKSRIFWNSFPCLQRWMVYVFCACFSNMLPQCACSDRVRANYRSVYAGSAGKLRRNDSGQGQ